MLGQIWGGDDWEKQGLGPATDPGGTAAWSALANDLADERWRERNGGCVAIGLGSIDCNGPRVEGAKGVDDFCGGRVDARL